MPISTPVVSASSAAIPTPSARRCRLAAVSAQNRMRPDRRSGSVTSRTAVSTIWVGAGNSLSAGLSARRASEARI
jgi:hypothetical protein